MEVWGARERPPSREAVSATTGPWTDGSPTHWSPAPQPGAFAICRERERGRERFDDSDRPTAAENRPRDRPLIDSG